MNRSLRAIALLGLLLLLLPASTPASGRVIGALLSSDQPRYREAHRQMLKVLSGRGYTATSEIIVQTPNPDHQSWANAMRKLTAYRADLIVAYGASAVATALKEGDGAPVVACDAVLPEGAPASTLCGITARVPMITLLRVLQEIKPAQQIGVLYNSREVGSLRQLEELRRAARKLPITLIEANTGTPGAVEAAANSLIGQAGGLIVTESSVVCRQFEQIAARARKAGVPMATPLPDGAERGALVSLEISPAEQGEVAGQMAIRLLEGARPEQLGIASPRKIELVLNLKVARDIEVVIPFQVLGMATRILK
ncbi:MAG: ABC transporter substrate-binding protein [Trichlorobacter sp.]|jgi:putative ABC transport system substrate-binding protein